MVNSRCIQIRFVLLLVALYTLSLNSQPAMTAPACHKEFAYLAGLVAGEGENTCVTVFNLPDLSNGAADRLAGLVAGEGEKREILTKI
jgi:hypothetical protein